MCFQTFNVVLPEVALKQNLPNKEDETCALEMKKDDISDAEVPNKRSPA